MKFLLAFWQREYLTKRDIGLLLMAVGIAGIIAPFLIDWVGAGAYAGIGPTQRAVMIIAGILTLLGLSLIPLGDKPA